MSNQAVKKQAGFSLPAGIVIVVLFVIAYLIWEFWFGAAGNFVDAARHEPVKEGFNSYLGTIYLGGPVVPVLLTLFMCVVTFSIERFITIRKAYGAGSIEMFLQNIKTKLASNDIQSAIAECNKQKGSVANVVQAGLTKYAEMEKASELNVEQKVINIGKEIEETTSLEMPMLEKNLSIIATIASVGTLVALFGTVLGMIRAFKAMGASGTPDPTALATGISEALINTALGIFSSALAIIAYNYFTGMIDKLTYSIDEVSFTIQQTFSGKHGK